MLNKLKAAIRRWLEVPHIPLIAEDHETLLEKIDRTDRAWRNALVDLAGHAPGAETHNKFKNRVLRRDEL